MDVTGKHPALQKAVKPPAAGEKVTFSYVPASVQGGRSSTSAAAAAAAAEKGARAALSDLPGEGSGVSLSQQHRDLLAQKYQELFSAIDKKYAELVDQGIEEGLEYAKLEREISLAVEKLEDLKVSLQEDSVDRKIEVGPAAAAPALVEVMPKLVAVGHQAAEVGSDSTQWTVVEAGSQRHPPGKCVVRTLSLKDGRDEFVRLAESCREHGEAVLVIASNEVGTAKTVKDKVEICQSCMELLRSAGFGPEQIFLDASVLSVGTAESKSNGINFLDAVAELRQTFPEARLCGDISMISGLLKRLGQDAIQQTLEAVFLHHCIRRGLNYAILEVDAIPRYADVHPALRNLCEELIFDSSLDGQHLYRFLTFVSRGPPKGSGPAVGPSGLVQEAPLVRGNLRTLVFGAVANVTSAFSMFGSKSHNAFTAHRLQHGLDMLSTVFFSSISVYLGQAGAVGPTAASSVLDGLCMWQNHQQLGHKANTIQWGPIGGVGIRRMYGSRDVFDSGVDLGQKLIYVEDATLIMRIVLIGTGIPVGPVVYETEEDRVKRQYGQYLKVEDKV